MESTTEEHLDAGAARLTEWIGSPVELTLEHEASGWDVVRLRDVTVRGVRRLDEEGDGAMAGGIEVELASDREAIGSIRVEGQLLAGVHTGADFVVIRLHGLVAELSAIGKRPRVANPFTEKELDRHRRERSAAARRIDPTTAHGCWTHALDLDPYGELEVPDELAQVGRCPWLFDPGERIWITEYEVRELHPGFSDGEWEELVRAAHRREVEVRGPSGHDEGPPLIEAD